MLTIGRAFIRSFLRILHRQIAHTSLYHWQGWPFAPAEPVLMLLVGLEMAYLLVGIYIALALIFKKHRTPYDWAVESMLLFSGKVFATW
jgi:hypothetical protein